MAAGEAVAGPAEEPRHPRTPVDVGVNSVVVPRQRPGAWSVLGLTATNTGDAAAEGLVSVFFPPDSRRQFARRVWVPPHAERTSWLPVEVPAGIPQAVTRQSYTVLSLDPTATQEVLVRRDGETLTTEGLMAISHDTAKTAAYLNRPAELDHPAAEMESAEQSAGGGRRGSDPDAEALDTVVASRLAVDLDESCGQLWQEFLPPWADCLQGYDHMIVTSDRITQDAAGLAALRAWVRGGGRLWIMADRVRPATLSALLGNAAHVEPVDRVELDQFTIESRDEASETAVADTCDFEEPAVMLRVVTSAADVPCRVNGWPAAIWVPYGEGEVLLTTLGSRGWRSADGKTATPGLKLLAKRFFAARKGRPNLSAAGPALQQLVGYRVPGLGLPLAVLGGYCLTLIGGGLLCARRKRPEGMLVLVPIASLVAAGLMAARGVASARSVPPTVVTAQLLEMAPETDECQAESLLAIYDQRSRTIDWQAARRHLFTLDRAGEGEVNRREWTDDDTVVLPDTHTRAGSVESATVVGSQPLATRVAAVARFGPEGLVGKLSTGSLADVSDAVILSPPAAAAAVTLGKDGQLACRPDQILTANDFSAETLLSDEQRWRQDFMRTLFHPHADLTYPRRDSVAFWCRPVEQGVSLPEGFEARGSGLAIVPLEFQRTPPGTAFRIPANFLRITTSAGRQGRSIAFDPRTGQWRKDPTTASETVLRFALPTQVVPCRLDHGTLTVRLNAPSRSFTVSTYQEGKPVELRAIDNPSGVFEFPLAAEHLAQDERGGVRIVLTVGPTAGERSGGQAAAGRGGGLGASSSRWQIDYARLTVAGRTLAEQAPADQ